MEFFIFVVIPFCFGCLLLAMFVRGVQEGFADTRKYLLSGGGGLASVLKSCFILVFKGSKAFSKHGYDYVSKKREALAYRRDSTHEIQDVIANIEAMLRKIDRSLFFVEIQEIKKKYRYFTREYNFFRDSPLFKKRSANHVRDANAEIQRLLSIAENIEESLHELYRDQEGIEPRQH